MVLVVCVTHFCNDRSIESLRVRINGMKHWHITYLHVLHGEVLTRGAAVRLELGGDAHGGREDGQRCRHQRVDDD